MQRTTVQQALHEMECGQSVTVAGWVRTRRDSKGGFSFIELNDGSCLANLQIIADSNLSNYHDVVLSLPTGASIRVEGKLTPSTGGKQRVELIAESLTLLGGCDPEAYPLQKKRISFERLREVAHLRARTNTFGAVARLRNTLAAAVHEFFQARGFLYVHAPIITTNDCEGAGEMFRVTTLDPLHPPLTDKQAVDFQEDFFGQPTALTVSGQLEAETYACALGNVYTFGPTFRAENSNTRRHLAEFWMIEPEMAFADLQDDADLAEAFLRHLFSRVLERSGEDLAFFNEHIQNNLLDTLRSLASSRFERITYTEAIALLQKAATPFEFAPEWGADLQSEHERYLTEEVFHGPVTVTDYPVGIKAFYMRLSDDERTVAAMDVLLPSVGEIIGGSQREERLDVLERRIRACGLDPRDYWWYADLRRFGSVPHAGFGLGFERLVQFCTGMHNIRDVIPFPRTPKKRGVLSLFQNFLQSCCKRGFRRQEREFRMKQPTGKQPVMRLFILAPEF